MRRMERMQEQRQMQLQQQRQLPRQRQCAGVRRVESLVAHPKKPSARVRVGLCVSGSWLLPLPSHSPNPSHPVKHLRF
jgi:hypothetical protein